MVIRKLLLAGAAAGLIVSGCSRAEHKDPSGASANVAHEQAIRSNITNWLDQIRKRDAAAIARNYTEDGVLMAPGAAIAEGQPAIEQGWRGMMQTPGFDLTFAPQRIVISSSGDMAMDRGTYRFTSSGPNGPVTDTGKYLVVWRNVNGEWKAAADIFNSDGAPPAN